MKMTKSKILIASVVIGSTALLSACGSHKNPLLTQPKKATVTFVKKAQVFAEKKTKVYSGSGVYDQCITNPHHFDGFQAGDTGAKRCEKVFKAMVEYAGKSKHFASLTVSDLKDEAVQKRFGNDGFDI